MLNIDLGSTLSADSWSVRELSADSWTVRELSADSWIVRLPRLVMMLTNYLGFASAKRYFFARLRREIFPPNNSREDLKY